MCKSCVHYNRRDFVSCATAATALTLFSRELQAQDSSFQGIVPREKWSLVPPNASPGSTKQYALSGKPKFVSIHYTSFFAKHPDYQTHELVRNLQAGHMRNKGFGDIAYHYIVTLPGDIYEGRPISVAPASGTYYHSPSELTDSQYTSNGRLIAKSSADKTAPGNTSGHITVSFNVGIGSPEMLPETVMDRGAKLVAKLLFENNLTPDDVRAHREFANSICPGDQIYEWLRGPKMQRDGVGPGMSKIKEEYALLVGG